MNMTPFLAWLLRASWQAALLALLVLAAQWAFQKRLTARWRYALWLLVLARLALPAAPSSALQRLQPLQLCAHGKAGGPVRCCRPQHRLANRWRC
jgi:beta-lactamase regulating signal transducer with metallopeptidase domain